MPVSASSTRSSAGTASATRGSPASATALSAELLFFVPLGHTAEVHQVTLTNEVERRSELKLFSFVEFCLWNA